LTKAFNGTKNEPDLTINKTSNTRFGVLGGGSWATAIVKMLCNNCSEVQWWNRNQESVDFLNKYRRNPRYLTSVQFEENQLKVTTDMQAVIDASDVIIVAIPSAYIAGEIEGSGVTIPTNKLLISAVKGIVPEYNAIPARFFHKTYGLPYDQIGIICGPCHAEEVALEKLSYLTIACSNAENAQLVADALSCRYIKTQISDDLFGTEISAILKNVYAVAGGICHGLGYGDNFLAVLVSNAIIEIERFVDAVSPIHRDVKSSAYLGDLMVTAYSPYSRNRTFGNMLGKGLSAKMAMYEMNMVAEGYYATKSIHAINQKFKVDLPIHQAVYNIVYEKIAPAIEIRLLTEKLT